MVRIRINQYNYTDEIMVRIRRIKYNHMEEIMIRIRRNGHSGVLVMLDLSAAFDVIDYDILFNRLQHSFGIDGDALLWIKSYLHGRSQRVAIGPVKSNSMELNYDVPQGSVLGPTMYYIFSKPIGAICSRHDL